MALTEEQLEETTLRVAQEMRVALNDDEAVEFVRGVIAALPKPEAVGTVEYGAFHYVSINWHGELPKAGTLLYTEPHITQPASEQKPVEWGGVRHLLEEAIAAKKTMQQLGIPTAQFHVMFDVFVKQYVDFSAGKSEHTDEYVSDYKAQRDAWQPIDTAPKDGSHVQLFRPFIQFVGYYGGAESGWRINAPGLPAMWPEPTHWMPLQKAPAIASVKGGA